MRSRGRAGRAVPRRPRGDDETAHDIGRAQDDLPSLAGDRATAVTLLLVDPVCWAWWCVQGRTVELSGNRAPHVVDNNPGSSWARPAPWQNRGLIPSTPRGALQGRRAEGYGVVHPPLRWPRTPSDGLVSSRVFRTPPSAHAADPDKNDSFRKMKEPTFDTRIHRRVMTVDEPGSGPHVRPGTDVTGGVPAPERGWDA